MNTTGIALRPSYWASVSGGKDSLYMLKLILSNLTKYPLDGVVHFELEIDYPFIKTVIDYMQAECEKYGIRFVRLKPTKTWGELYNRYGFPTRKARWCNDKYKLTAVKQLEEFLKGQGFYLVSYIGYCADEEKRFARRVNLQKVERYPLVEEGIHETSIWNWARKQPIFNHYYETQKRCGCMYCPMSSMMNYAYLYKYYPENFTFLIDRMRETEKLREQELGRPFSVRSSKPEYNADYIERSVKNKWQYTLDIAERWNSLCADADAYITIGAEHL